MKILSFIFIVIAVSGCRLTDYSEKEGITTDVINTPTSSDVDENIPVLTLSVNEIDLGTLTQGELIEYDLEIKNTGEGQLILTDVRASCGCTVSKDWPREAIPPGEKGIIKVSFNSEGKSGHSESTISIVANTRPASTAILLKADVLAPELFED